jgi:hypothetical protein
MSWRYVLFLLGIHTPAAATELLDITLTRQWEGGLLGFMLEQSAMGQLIAELSPGTPADVDGSLLPGDVIIGAEGLAEGLFDQASLHECRVLDTFPPGTELSSMWHRRGLFLSYRSVRLVVERTPPFEVASASAAVAGPLGEWQPVRLTMTREFGSYDLAVSSMTGEVGEAGEVLRVVHGRRVLLSRIAVVGTLLELTVVTASPAEVRRGAEERVPHAAKARGAAASASAAEGAVEEAENGVAAEEAGPSAGEPSGLATAAQAAEAAAEARLEATRALDQFGAAGSTEAEAEAEAAASAAAAAVEAQHASGVGPFPSETCTADDPSFFDQEGQPP